MLIKLLTGDFQAADWYLSRGCIGAFPITSWEIDGETMEAVSDFIFWGSKITADGDCSHEIFSADALMSSEDLVTQTCLFT